MNPLRVGTPLKLTNLTLIPIEQVVLRYDPGDHPLQGQTPVWIAGIKKPYALVFRDAHTTWSLDISGQPVDLSCLIKDVPNLQYILDSAFL